MFCRHGTVDGSPTLKVIAGVELTSGKELYSKVGGTVGGSDVKLYVVDDNGIPIMEVQEGGTEVPAEQTIGFTDVLANAYYADAVKWAVEHNITNGTTPTAFSPDKTCTRGEIVTFLWRAYGFPEPKSTVNPLTDVKSSDYF